MIRLNYIIIIMHLALAPFEYQECADRFLRLNIHGRRTLHGDRHFMDDAVFDYCQRVQQTLSICTMYESRHLMVRLTRRHNRIY